MKQIKLKVEKITKGEKNGNFIHTLKTEGTTVTIGGVEKVSGQRTFYISLPKPIELKEFMQDMDLFRIEERPYKVEDRTTGEVREIMLKWLHIK